jgi:hypothetical protein
MPASNFRTAAAYSIEEVVDLDVDVVAARFRLERAALEQPRDDGARERRPTQRDSERLRSRGAGDDVLLARVRPPGGELGLGIRQSHPLRAEALVRAGRFRAAKSRRPWSVVEFVIERYQ